MSSRFFFNICEHKDGLFQSALHSLKSLELFILKRKKKGRVRSKLGITYFQIQWFAYLKFTFICVFIQQMFIYSIIYQVLCFKKKKTIGFLCQLSFFLHASKHPVSKNFFGKPLFFFFCCRWHCLLCISIKKAVTKCQLPHLIKVKVQFCDS